MKKIKPAKTEENMVSEFVQITMSVPYGLLRMFDEESQRRGYTRSEAIRQGMRKLLETWTGRAL